MVRTVVHLPPYPGLVRVSGESMSPTLAPGDLLLVMYAVPPRPQTLVVADLPPTADGTERPLAVKRLTGPDPSDPTRWWLERDNPRTGADSWLFGSVPAEAIRGRVVGRIWPRPGRPGRGIPG